MNEVQKLTLLACQVNKHIDRVGRKEVREYFREVDKEIAKQKLKDITPQRVDHIKEKGISCTRVEMARYK